MSSASEIERLSQRLERVQTEIRSMRSDLIKVALAVGEVRGDVLNLAARKADRPR